MAESRISNALENSSFVASFMHLELKKECKEDYLKVGTKHVRIGQDS